MTNVILNSTSPINKEKGQEISQYKAPASTYEVNAISTCLKEISYKKMDKKINMLEFIAE